MYISEKDIEFAKTILSNFVNGGMSSAKTVAAQMSLDHRYLQNEMFKICLEYIKVLAMNYQNGNFDGRNESACVLANDIISYTQSIEDLTEDDWEEYQERLRSIHRHRPADRKFEAQRRADVGGVNTFASNLILDLGVGYISYAPDMNETAVVLKGADGIGTMYLIVDGDKRDEAERKVAEYSTDKWLKDGVFGEITAWASQHPDLNVERSSIGRGRSRCGFMTLLPQKER